VSRQPLNELRADILDYLELLEDWTTAYEVTRVLRLGNNVGYLRASLILERLAHEGELELRNPKSRGKRFFRRASS
jgi:hypothetical protein